MIRNMIFDMGNVLLRFEPEAFMQRIGVAPEDRPVLWREIYHSREWVQMDHGTLSEADAAEQIAARVPKRLRDAVYKLTAEWDRHILPVEGMAELAQRKALPIAVLFEEAFHYYGGDLVKFRGTVRGRERRTWYYRIFAHERHRLGELVAEQYGRAAASMIHTIEVKRLYVGGA